MTGNTPPSVSNLAREGAELEPGELAAVLDVLRAAYPARWPHFPLRASAEEHLRWKLEGPGAAGSLVLLTSIDGQLVGLMSRLRRKVLVRGTQRLGAVTADGAIHPDHQGRGLSRARREMNDSAFDAVDFTWGVTHNPVSLHIGRSVGILPLGRRLQVLVRPLDVRRLVELDAAGGQGAMVKGGRRAKALALRALLAARRPFTRPLRVDRASAIQIHAVSAVDERFDALWEEVAPGFDFALVRDATYLHWRYLDPRGGEFTLLVAEDGGELVGYLAFALYEERCRIADILVRPDRVDVASALVGETVARAREAGAAAVGCWLPAVHPYLAVLRGRGFLDSGRDAGINYRPVGIDPAELDVLRDPATRLHITQGDMDIV